MNINIIFLDYERHQFTKEVKTTNFKNAGYPYNFTIVDMKGISAAINEGIKRSKGFDAVVTMANDIIMPDNWLLDMVNAYKAIPNTGMCGLHCVEKLGEPLNINGIQVCVNHVAFGNVLIPMKAIKDIGGFNEDYDPYGMQDSDYGMRLTQSGYICYYLHGKKSQHIGHDVGQPSDYRRMKDEGLSLCGEKWGKWNQYYSQNGYTINQIEWPE